MKLKSVNVALLMLLALLSSAATASAQAPNLSDTTERITLKSQVLGEERVLLVRTPPGYAARTGERFPVLYMTDGDEHIQHTSSTISFLARNARMPEMIVVGILNTDRIRDLSPTHLKRLPSNPNASFPTSGGADKFLKFIETELIPLVESKYRTQPHRTFAGHSLGGLFAIYAMITKPELFNSYIAASPPVQWDDYVLMDRVKEFFKTRKEYNRTFFISLGNEPAGMGEAFNMFRDELQRQQMKGFVWEAVRYDDEDHGSSVLRSYYAGLRKIYDGWQYPHDPETGAVAGGLKGVEEHYRKLSERLNYTVNAPEELVNQVGYQLIGQGNMADAVAAFKLNVERYPGSANVYDSLGEAYERDGKLELALTNYEKAHQLGLQTNHPNTDIFKAHFDHVATQIKQAKPASSADAKQ